MKEGIREALFVFIAVGTPSDEDGSADLQHVIAVAREIGKCIEKYTIVIDKSTVPVGTAEKVREAVREELEKRGKSGVEFDVVSNPEFLKRGNALEDFIRPDRVIIGTDTPRAAEKCAALFHLVQGRPGYAYGRPGGAYEYAANAMLATRISFMNELARLCEVTGADVESVRRGIGSDSRIGNAFLYAGIGYGGSCFPKDVKALIYTQKDYGFQPKILSAVEEVNKLQRDLFIRKIVGHLGEDLSGVVFAVWGLAFKPQTDDMREAPAIDIIRGLRDRGASFKAYDPIAVDNARRVIGDTGIEYVKNNYDALKGVDALLLLTEWHHFREPDFEKMKDLMKKPVIFDGRNQYDPKKMKEAGFTYFSIGR